MQEIIIADDDTFVHGGMAFFLSTLDDFKIVSTLSNGHDVMKAAMAYPEAIIILDMALPGRHGFDILKELKDKRTNHRVIVLTGMTSHQLLSECIEAGANAVLTKVDGADQLYEALKNIHKTTCFLGPSVQQVLYQDTNENNLALKANTINTITTREKEIMILIADGSSTPAIAEKLNIAVSTVRKHRENLMTKLNCHNTAEITSYVIKRGLHIQ